MTVTNPTTGLVTSYDLTTGIIVEMDEAIYLLTPQDAPLLTGFNADGLAVLPTDPTTQVEFDWMDEEVLTPRSSLNGALTTATAVVTVKTGDRPRFSTGDIIRFGTAGSGERVRITGYGTTADTLLVTRAYAGTATNHADGAAVVGLGTALPEGSDPQAARAGDRTKRSNICQIFGPTQVSISGTGLVVPRYGVRSEWAKQLGNKTLEITIAREQAYIYGVKVNDPTTKIRTTAGLDSFIQTHVDSTSTQLTVETLQLQQQAGYNSGGVGDILLANPVALGDLNNIDDTTRVRTTPVDTTRGRKRVMTVDTEFGTVTVTRDRYVLPSDAYLYKREQTKRRILRTDRFEMLAKTGDSQHGQYLAEEGLQVKGEQHMGKFTALAY